MLKYLIAGAAAVACALYAYFSDSGDRDDRPPPHSRSYEPPQPPVYRRPEQKNRKIIEPPRPNIVLPAPEIAPNDDPTSLRTRAEQEADLMKQYFQRSNDAYARRDHVSAKAFSAQGKRHESTMKNLHALASASIFKENNRYNDASEVDLHGLYVKEAIAYSDKAIKEARRRGDSEVRLIVGKGNHTIGGIPKLKPALQKHLHNCGISVEVDQSNPGVLLAQVGSRGYMF